MRKLLLSAMIFPTFRLFKQQKVSSALFMSIHYFILSQFSPPCKHFSFIFWNHKKFFWKILRISCKSIWNVIYYLVAKKNPSSFISYETVGNEIRPYRPGSQRCPVPAIRYSRGGFLLWGLDSYGLRRLDVCWRWGFTQWAAVNHFRWGTKQH